MTPSLVARLIAPVAALAGLLLILAIGSAWYVRSLQRSGAELIASNVASMQAAQELEISLREVRTQFTRYLITQDEGHLKPIPRLKGRTAEALATAERTAHTPKEQELMRRVRVGHEDFFRQYDKILREEPKQWVYPKIFVLTDEVFEKEILEPAHEYLRLNEGGLTSTTEANQRVADHVTIGLIGLGVCGAIGGLLAGTLIAVALRRSLMSAEEKLRLTAAELGLALPPRSTADSPGTPIDPVEQMRQSASAVLARLRQTERDALRAEQLAWVGQMAAGLAHEVRNPLMAIKLLVQAAGERRGSFRGKDLQVLEEEIVRLEQIVSEFLDFARPPRLDPRPVDVKELAERAVDGVRARADLQSVALRVEVDPGPAVASADANQVRQVLFNLLFNALDAQPDGGHVTVRVGMDRDTAGEPAVVVAVADGGPGLPPDMSERVFEPFVSTKESGLGLGLSICRRIAETHGGGLTAVSSPQGATFTLRLPVVPPPQPPALSA